eukprot:403342241
MRLSVQLRRNPFDQQEQSHFTANNENNNGSLQKFNTMTQSTNPLLQNFNESKSTVNQGQQQRQFGHSANPFISNNENQMMTQNSFNSTPFKQQNLNQFNQQVSSQPQLHQFFNNSNFTANQSANQFQQNRAQMKIAPSSNVSLYDQTYKFMMESQKLRKKELDRLKDDDCVLLCYKCQKPVRVVDQENDKLSKMTKNEQEMIIEDERQVGKVSNDIVEVYIKQKCAGCSRFTCENCMDECYTCGLRECNLCLEYDGNNQTYYCGSCYGQ